MRKVKKSSPSEPTPSFFERYTDRLLAALLSGAAMLYSLLNFQYKTGVYNDDAVYVLGARSLWDHSFHSLILRPDYPMPGLPILLAPFAKLVEPHWTLLEWVATGVTLIAVYGTSKLALRYLPPGEALLIASLFALNRFISKFSGILMPATAYTAAIVLCFLLMSHLYEHFSKRGAILLGFLAGWGALVRPEGFIALVCIASTLVFSNRGRKILAFALPSVSLWSLAYLFWWKLHHTTQTEFGGDLDALKTFWLTTPRDGVQFALRLLNDFLVFPMTTLQWTTDPSPLFLRLIAMGALLAATGAGFYDLWKHHRSQRPVLFCIAFFSAAYFAVHVFWHISQSRYVIPLMPFMMILFVHGIAKHFPKFQRPTWALAALLVLLMPHFYRNKVALAESLSIRNPMKAPPWKALAWLNAHTAPETKTMSAIAPSIELYANRPSLPGLRAGNLEMFIYRMHLADLDYVVDRHSVFVASKIEGTDDPNRFWDLMHVRIDLYPKAFRLVFEDTDEQSKIYHIKPDVKFVQAYELHKKAYDDYQAGRMDEAYQKVSESLRIYPDLGSASNLVGAIYWKRNDLKNAISAFLTATEHLPTSTHPLLNLATLHQQLGQDAAAELYVTRAQRVGKSKGEEAAILNTITDLRSQWQTRRGVVFMDAP